MTTPKKTLTTLLVITAALFASLLPVPSSVVGAQEVPSPCSANGEITKTLAAGTTWKMCYHIHARKGLVLEAIYFKGPHDDTFRRVLDSIALTQLNVPYDSGQHQWNDITSYGFGNQYLQKMDPSECPDGEMLTVDQSWQQGQNFRQRSIPAICVQEVDYGLAYRSHEQDWGSINDELLFTGQGTELVVSIISKVDWYEYQSQYRFSDNGTIVPRLGATGDISPEDFAAPQYGWPVGVGNTDHATSHHHSAFWRVDFGLDDQPAQVVRQYDTVDNGTGSRGPRISASVTDITQPANVEPGRRRWYWVSAPESLNADGHPRSYEINFAKNDPYERIPESKPEITFTNYKECQQFATVNPTAGGCTGQRNVLEYVSTDTGPLTDPVAWVNVGYHHVVRDEDQSPMTVHWQYFHLVPRDFSHQSPLAPPARHCVNGDPGGQVDSTDHCGNATTVDLELSATSQLFGTASPASATIDVDAVSGSVVPEGTVSLIDGESTVIASGLAIDGDGGATVPLPSDLAAGSYELTAVFAPAEGTEWVTSRSEALPFTVVPADLPFVKAALTDFLGSAEDEAVLDAVAALEAGTTKTEFLQQLTTSDAWLTAVVDKLYLDTLGRPSDTAGRDHWIGELRAGRRTVAQVAAFFYSSSEYYQRAGGTDAAWIDDLYVKILRRPADAAGRDSWVEQTGARGRTWVAGRFYQSNESAQTRVRSLYSTLLGRAADAEGLAHWTPRVKTEGDLALAVFLASSTEYTERAITRFP